MRCKWIYEIADNKKLPFSRFKTSTQGKIYENSDDIIYNARNQFRTYQRAYLPK